ncbi:Reverse transcriptase RNA-dependent DNA polymerase [Arabidopsis thaliana x Arabidopsis arenosa]|uniref:Reverse transcriptase RNA-dependent DNA polymerase n=1 Tax=Arabidopsis thaliana x Arabidopsis arenosa TaxID=1240361 RepID=A0A8T1YC64_9BRAS|nr:Reverse transcriptase RNA-dependent DNA polymerase [Arabidopsis thaliana x Arabidopsis arenosa]
MLLSRDVIFRESVFPYTIELTTQSSPSPSSSNNSDHTLSPANDDLDIDQFDPPAPAISPHSPADQSHTSHHHDSVLPTPPAAVSDSPAAATDTSPAAAVPDSPAAVPDSRPAAAVPDLNHDRESVSNAENSVSEPEKLGFGYRKKQPPVKLADYVTSLVYTPSPSATPYPIDNYISSSQFSDKYQAFVLAITSGHEPVTYQEAITDENWRYAVKDEIEALEENGTWTVETLPEGKKPIGCKWVFRLKFNADGTLERHKARLVVLGNNQKEGIDYAETFAPVAKMITVRAFLQQVASLDWEVHQMDVHNAFLHGDLDEEVYMKFPPGFRTDDDTKVCRLRKSLYGLKQAPRCWFAKLGSAMKTYGFDQNYSDYSLFTLEKGDTRLHVLVYVDDLIITGSSIHVVNEFKHYLSTCFHMKDLGPLRYFLGIEVARSPEGIYLCQRKYTLDIIAETGLMGVKPITFPLEQNHKLSLAKDDPFSDPTRYRRLVGRLIYLGNTRPELSYAIHILSQFMNNPQQAHWNAALRVVRYLKNSPGQGILLRANTTLTLSAWCDSDHGACPITSRSLTGWFIQLGDSPLSWKTKKHDVVSRSSAEAEYRAMADTVSELMWLCELLPTLGIKVTAPVTLHSDSLSAIMLAANPVFHARTKHVARDVHFVRDEIIRGTIATKHVSTTSQLADIMTKALGRQQFEDFLVKLGVCNLHTPP